MSYKSERLPQTLLPKWMFRVKTSRGRQRRLESNDLERLVFLVDVSTTEKQGVLARREGGKSVIVIIKKFKNRALAVIILLGMMACASDRPAETRAPTPAPTVRETHVVIDDLGRSVTVPVIVTRVISTAPSITENIFAVGAGDRLVGVTTFCDYPEEAKAISKIGDTLNPNIETIIGLRPDIVFVSSASQLEAFMNTLEANGIAVFVTNARSLADVLRGVRQIGDLMGTSEQTARIMRDLETRLFELTRVTSLRRQDRVFVQISREPLFTIGKDSFLNEIISLAGGKSVTEKIPSAYPKLSKETAASLNPEVIILSESEDNREPNEVFRNSPAVKNGRVYKINADILSRPGPRLLDAAEKIKTDLQSE